MSRKGNRVVRPRKQPPAEPLQGLFIALRVLLGILIAIMAVGAIYLLFFFRSEQTAVEEESTFTLETTAEAAEEAEETEDAATVTAEPDEAGNIAENDSEQLVISNLFSSSIPNPDCNMEVADGVASVAVTNVTEEYLLQACITATLADGTELYFIVNDLPAGETAQIFEINNRLLPEDAVCTSISCQEEQYLTGDQLLTAYFLVTVEGSTITITNLTGSTLTGYAVICHDSLGDSYYGGTSYTYSIGDLASWASITIQAEDCILGDAQPVRICNLF